MLPKYEALFEMDEQYYIGSSGLLVMPITAKKLRRRRFILPKIRCGIFLLIHWPLIAYPILAGFLWLLQPSYLSWDGYGQRNHCFGCTSLSLSMMDPSFQTYSWTATTIIITNETRPLLLYMSHWAKLGLLVESSTLTMAIPNLSI